MINHWGDFAPTGKFGAVWGEDCGQGGRLGGYLEPEAQGVSYLLAYHQSSAVPTSGRYLDLVNIGIM